MIQYLNLFTICIFKIIVFYWLGRESFLLKKKDSPWARSWDGYSAMWSVAWGLVPIIKAERMFIWGEGGVTSIISKLALFPKFSGECYQPQTLTDAVLLSWIDLRPFPTVHLCRDGALVDFLCFPFRAGQTKRREVSFILALFVLFCLYPIRATPLLTFRASNSCWTWRIPSCPIPRVKRSQRIFQGAWLKVLTDGDFRFVIQVLLKRHLTSWVRAFLSAFSHYILALFCE